MIGRLSRGFRLPPEERRLALEALATLALARVVLAGLPFPRAMACLGLRQESSGCPAARSSESDAAIIAVIGKAIRRAGRVAPFRAVCLQQSVAAALMLRRRGLPAEIHFGVTKPRDAAMLAHAWSICAGVVVTGESEKDRYTPLVVYSA